VESRIIAFSGKTVCSQNGLKFHFKELVFCAEDRIIKALTKNIPYLRN